MAATIRQAARAVAALDALTGLADMAASGGYCAPTVTDDRMLKLEASRHPVVEQRLVETAFTPNDVDLGDGTDLVVLTGPNASGKSCYLRQIGLIQLMTQIGSWVPARSATVGIADRIFTRVGAVDDLTPVNQPSWLRWPKPPTFSTTPAIVPWCFWMRSGGAPPPSMASQSPGP